MLYYKTDNDIVLAVPTFGYLYVIIDFGRAFLKPWPDRPGLISSVFGTHGECKSLAGYCDNPSIDMVRLIGSLGDVFGVIKNRDERHQMRDFCRRVCQTDDGQDYLKLLSESNGPRLQYLLEAFPRKHCHNALPERVLEMFWNLYRVDSCPEGVVPFPLLVGT